jgi:hypothetical protein
MDPRIDSISLLTFNWILVREAYLRIHFPTHPVAETQWQRLALSKRRTWHVRRSAMRVLAKYPMKGLVTTWN